MIIQNDKEYKDSLDSLTALINENNDDFDGTIDDLVIAIVKYENENFPIEPPPSWAVVEFHIYDRLVTKIVNLPLSEDERRCIATALYEKSDIPEELVDKVKNFKVKDIIRG